METLFTDKETIKRTIDENPTLNSIEIAKQFGFAQRTVTALMIWNSRRKNTSNKLDNIKKKIKKVEETLTKSDFKQVLDVEGNDVKDLARNRMVDWVIKSGVVGLCYGFPHLKCILEMMILKFIPEMTYFGVECKEKIYKTALSIIRVEKLPIKLNKGRSIEFLINAKRDTFAHLLLDYCNTLPSNYNEISLVIKNDLVQVNGIIAITFSRVLRNGTGDINNMWANFGNVITNDTERDMRVSCDVSNHAMIFNLVNERYVVREFFNYQSKSPMCLAIIQRIR
jgi:hypothetical protein